MKKIRKFTSLFVALFALLALTFLMVACAAPDGGEEDPKDAAVVSIALDTSAVKTEFLIGEVFSYSGLKVTATMDDGTTKDVDVADCTITAPDMVVEGEKTVTVKYEGAEATYIIKIVQSKPTVTGITIDTSAVPKEFVHNGTFSYAGLVVKAQLSDGLTADVSLEDCEITPPDLTQLGEQSVKVSYEGFEDEYTITVVPAVLSIQVDESGAKTVFEQDESFTAKGLIVKATMSDGADRTLETGYVVSCPDMSKPGVQEVAVMYGELDASYDITILEDSRALQIFEAEDEFAMLINGDVGKTDFRSWTMDSASGGKYVGGLTGNYGAQVCFRIDSPMNTVAVLKIRMAVTEVGVDFEDLLLLTVNGEDVSVDFTLNTFGSLGWDKWVVYRLGEISLQKGLNTITFTVPSPEMGTDRAGNTNIDYISLQCDEELVGYVEPAVEGATYIFEAETDAVLSSGLDPNGLHTDGETQTVTGYVGGFDANDGGRSITFRVISSKTSVVTLAVRISADGEDRSFSELATVYVNEKIVNNITVLVEADNPKSWVGWREVTLANIELKEGLNEIRFTSSGKIGGNFDRISLTAPDGTALSKPSGEYDVIEPVTGQTYTFEAEKGYWQGGAGVGTEGGVTFVGGFDRFMRRVTFAVDAASDTIATLSAVLSAPQYDMPFRNIAYVLVNGERIETNVVMPGSGNEGSWFDWTKVTLANISLHAGKNEIVFCAERGGNFDKIEMISSVELYDYYATITDVQGAEYRFEAENGDIVGAGNYGNYVGSFDPGTSVSFHIYARQAATVTLRVCLDAPWSDMFYRDICSLTLNGIPVDINFAIVAGAGNSGPSEWEQWTTVTIANVQLVEGENVFVFTSISAQNFDYFEIVSPVELSSSAFVPANV